MAETPASKEAVVLQLLEEGDTMLCLDARHVGVRVPAQHAQEPNLRLILNLNFPHPIEVTAEGISANLAFGGWRSACYIPMAALWAAFNPKTMQGMMWPDSMPPEVLADLAAKQQTTSQQAAPARPTKPPAAPRGVPRKGQASADQDQEKDAPPPPRQRGHLRVIK
jgi:stringent starvation protein B